MRISDRALLLGLALAACGQQPKEPAAPPGTASASGADTIPCAVRGAAMVPVCTVELRDRVAIVRNPDGGFHRLAITPDGHGVVAADGAEAATLSAGPDHDHVDVSIGGDRYRLPATVKAR